MRLERIPRNILTNFCGEKGDRQIYCFLCLDLITFGFEEDL